MSNVIPLPRKPASLAERFWSIARAHQGTGLDGDSVDPVKVVRHVLAILDALDRGDAGTPVSVRTISFLKLLRESEQSGDLSYAAPEQISGEVLDERSLVFSVGVLLFERLTGRHPFGAEGNPVRQVARISKGEFGSGVNYFPTVPSSLRTILMRAMGPFPEERWSSLRELRDHLEQFAEQNDPRTVPLPGTTVGRPSRRVPKSDSESTKIVDMSSQIRSELLAAAELRRRASDSTSGLIEVTDEPVESEPAPTPTVQVTPTPAAVEAPAPDPAGTIREADLLPELPRPDYVPSLTPAAPKGIKPLLWAGLGAAVATVAFIVLTSSGSDAPAASAAGGAASPAAAPTEPAPPAPEPSVTPAPAAADQDGTSAEPANAGAFDPVRDGLRAMTAGASCLTAAQQDSGVEFGVGMLWDHDSARIKKVYFAGADSGLPWKQRKCMQGKMVGTLAPAAPEQSHIVQYHVRIRGGEIHLKARD